MDNVTVTTTPEGGRKIVIDIAADRVAIIKHSNRSFTDVATSVVGEIEAKNLAIVMNDATAQYKADFAAGDVDGTLCTLGREAELLTWFMTRPDYESIIDRELREAAEEVERVAAVAQQAAEDAAAAQAALEAAEGVVADAEAALEE